MMKDTWWKLLQEKRGKDLIQTYDKIPYANRNVKRANWQQKRHQKFEYTAIADRLRTISCSNYSHLTGVVNRC